jgi:hypothetical protein
MLSRDRLQAVTSTAAVVPWTLLDELDAARDELAKAKRAVDESPWNVTEDLGHSSATAAAGGSVSGSALSAASTPPKRKGKITFG